MRRRGRTSNQAGKKRPAKASPLGRRKARKPGSGQADVAQRSDKTATSAGTAAQLQDEIERLNEQFTATSEVLRIISASPGELEPVFQPVLESAIRTCRAQLGPVFRYTGELFLFGAEFGTPP